MVDSFWDICFRGKVLELGTEVQEVFHQADKAVVGPREHGGEGVVRTYGEDGGKDSRAYIPAVSGQESRVRAGDWQWEWKEDKSRTLEFSGPSNMADGGGVLEGALEDCQMGPGRE